MKRITIRCFLLMLLWTLFPSTGFAASSLQTPADTITIQIGKTKKIIIWVNDKEDLAGLQIYDFNKMISELSHVLDSLGHSKQVLIITDEKGEEFRIEVGSENDREDEEEIAEEREETEDLEEETEEEDSRWYQSEEEENEADETKKGIHFNNKKDDLRHFGTRHHLEFDLGMNNYLHEDGEFPGSDNEQYAVRPWGSWFVGINSNFRTHIAGPLALQWGGGISWYNFKFEDPYTRLEKTADELLFVREPDLELDAEKSKLTVSYLNLNLVPMLDFRRKTRIEYRDGEKQKVKHYNEGAFRIGLGGFVGYRLGSYAKYKFEDEKDKERDPFYLNNFRYGARLQIGFKGIDLFANYDLNPLFSETKAPELHAVSFGITL